MLAPVCAPAWVCTYFNPTLTGLQGLCRILHLPFKNFKSNNSLDLRYYVFIILCHFLLWCAQINWRFKALSFNNIYFLFHFNFPITEHQSPNWKSEFHLGPWWDELYKVIFRKWCLQIGKLNASQSPNFS